MKLGTEYIAAFIDCDGTVGITKVKYDGKSRQADQYYSRVMCYSQNLGVLQEIQEVVGGTICRPVSHGTYNLQLAPRDSAACLELVLPYLRIKRQQGELALRLVAQIKRTSIKGRRDANGKHLVTPKEVTAEREAMFLEMKRLNHEDSRLFKENRVNSVKALKKVIPSQAVAGKGATEGVTTREASPNSNPPQECPASEIAGRDSLSSAYNFKLLQ
jgi:hypothetical protein